MQFSSIIALALAGTSLTAATPAWIDRRQTVLCSGSNTPQCCATDVLNLADLDCFNPPTQPANTTDFINICAAEGQQAKCCLLPILEQGLICSDVSPA